MKFGTFSLGPRPFLKCAGHSTNVWSLQWDIVGEGNEGNCIFTCSQWRQKLPWSNILSITSLLLIVLFYCTRRSLHTLALLLFDLSWTQAILTADILTCLTRLELTGLSAAALTLDATVSGSCYCAPAWLTHTPWPNGTVTNASSYTCNCYENCSHSLCREKGLSSHKQISIFAAGIEALNSRATCQHFKFSPSPPASIMEQSRRHF